MIAVCWKWVALDDDVRWAGVSEADRAALEVALRLASAHDDVVLVVSLGPSEAEIGLRQALAAGAHEVLRIDASTELTSRAVAETLAIEIAASGPVRWVVCGDYSPDRGSGSVPAFLAAELGVAQALGLVQVDVAGPGITARRRLDGGRREELAIDAPAVISVEGSIASLRRAPLAREMAAKAAPVTVRPGPAGPLDDDALVAPFRPRPRVMPAPAGDDALARVRSLVQPTAAAGRSETVVADPPEAAQRIVAALRAWGYLADPGTISPAS
jgi:electron transfer flavoprotein beta subunit